MPRRIDADRLLEAAAEVFERHGYHDARVSEVARRAGVAQGSVYLYFESKERLYLAILERFAESVRRVSEGLTFAGMHSAVDMHDRFLDLYTEVFELCAQNRGVAGLLLGGPSVGRSVEIRARLIDAAEAISVAYLEAGVAAGLFRPVHTTTVARAIVGLLLHTAITTIVADGRVTGLRELAAELLDFELHGLLATDVPVPGGARSSVSASMPANP